jgi:hypothetical protein
MMSKPNEKKVIAVLMKQHGRTFSSELGIKMRNATPLLWQKTGSADPILDPRLAMESSYGDTKNIHRLSQQ